MDSSTSDPRLLREIWHALGGPAHAPEQVAFTGPERGLPSVYAVSSLASASIAASLLAIAELHALRTGRALPAIQLDRRLANAAFRSERYLTPIGWKLPPGWDPIAGDYPTRDGGFIRLHTNYSYHRDAVLAVLEVSATREAVRSAVATWNGEELEAAVVARGGCAALMRSPEAWAAHPQGRAVAAEALAGLRTQDAAPPQLPAAAAPLTGVRVLDLTRVIAGPICTRVLAGYGADVLRIDPPGFEEVGALLPETTAGKRRAQLDLRVPADRAQFVRLLADAHVLVHGYRADALARLGFDAARLREHNPNLISITHDAYGFTGRWAMRRGFDSLVQMSCGIAWRGRAAAGSPTPLPLPAQALDHGTGYLLAAATCRALTRLLSSGQASEVRLSLARTAKLLVDQGDTGDLGAPDFSRADAEPWLEAADSAFGPLRRVPCPAGIEGISPNWGVRAGNLGVDAAAW